MQTIKDELHLTLLVLEQNENGARTTSVGIEITDEKSGM
jgi:hypothetical protein